MADPPPSARLGGMALANGLLVHGPRHWAAAVRDEDGRLIIASGRKRLLRAGRLTDLPIARGLARLGEAFAVLPAVKRGLPQARFALEDPKAAAAAVGATAVASIARRRLRSVLAQEAVAAVAGLAPALVTLRGSQVAVWHAVEHKSIAAYEAGGADEVANAADHAKEHDRCGSNLVVPLLVTTTIGNTVARKLFGRRALGGRTASPRSASARPSRSSPSRRGGPSTRSRAPSTRWATRCSRASRPASPARATCWSARPRWRPCCAPRRPTPPPDRRR